MPVRCTHCGYENDTQYRFCGMCGKDLPAAAPGTGAPESSPQGISGPSFLGLAENPKRSVEYLLEDEPPAGHGRMYLALALLVVSAGLLVWHWRRDGYPWAPVPVTQSAAGAAAAPTAGSAAPAEAPAASAPEKTEVAEPAAGSKSGAASGSQDSQVSPGAAPGDTPAPTGLDAKTEDTNGAATPVAPAETAAAPHSAASRSSKTETRKVETRAEVPALSYTDKLVADGEKYLYGNGVAEDCDRAQKNLQGAAKRSSAKAESILGTMYTTGHCVSRDLPTAYHWFARALRHDAGNARIEQDLAVVWKQMTPGERQVALRNQ